MTHFAPGRARRTMALALMLAATAMASTAHASAPPASTDHAPDIEHFDASSYHAPTLHETLVPALLNDVPMVVDAATPARPLARTATASLSKTTPVAADDPGYRSTERTVDRTRPTDVHRRPTASDHHPEPSPGRMRCTLTRAPASNSDHDPQTSCTGVVLPTSPRITSSTRSLNPEDPTSRHLRT